MTDGCAAQIAAGTLRPGDWGFVVGTTIVLKGVSERLLRDPAGALYSHRSPDGRWWPGGASSAGGGLLDLEFPSADLARLQRDAATREPAGCVTYPLVGVGERFPFRRPDARRFTIGDPGDEADRFAAVLQGVGFVQRLCLDYVRSLGASVADRISVTGGAARSGYWLQVQADILRRKLAVPRFPEGAVGMAVLAACRGRDLATAADRMTAPARVYRPRDHADRFDPPYARLVGELAARGWIDGSLARTALAGVGR
jgi:xylulokinase